MSFEGIEHPEARASVRFAPGERVKYVPNHRSFGAFMKSERMREVVAKVAADIAREAGRLAPKSPGPGPHMADQFVVEPGTGFMKVGGNIRVSVRVVNHSDHAAVNEFGGKHNKAARMLGRAGSKFGDWHLKGGGTPGDARGE